MKEIEFNLLDEPWIRVMTDECDVRECSLMQVLTDSHRYRCLAGEMPTQDVAILRLLLAVLHTVFSRVDPDGAPDPLEDPRQAIGRWRALWNAGALPEKPIRTYLETWRGRFWLFHPERPFYQVPDMEKASEYGAAKLNGELSESGNKLRLFPVRAGEEKARLTYAEAARWLVYLNGFDDTSSKPKGKGLPTPGAGWLGKLGLIFAEGNNLFETLLLNLVLCYDDGYEIWGEPKPVWERDRPKSAERTEIAMPDNQAELLTLQSRRLLLDRDEYGVTGYRLLGGDFFSKINAIAEQMTLWDRRTEKGKISYYDQPRRLIPERQMWRDFGVITGTGSEGRIPGVVSWVSTLEKKDALSRERMIRFRTAGLKYGDKDFFVEDTIEDHLDFHTGLLEKAGLLWGEEIQSEIKRTDRAAWLLGKLAEGIFKAEGGQSGSTTQAERAHQAAQEYYGAVDIPFRQWLCSIDPEQGDGENVRSEKCAAWRQDAYRIVLRQGKKMVQNAGSSAFVGRWVKDGKADTETFSSSVQAFNYFVGSIRKCFGISQMAKEAAHE